MAKKLTKQQKRDKVARQFVRRFNQQHRGLERYLGTAQYYQLYDQLFDKQNGRCGICGKLWLGKVRMAMDHDHETMEVRGLLCYSCNTKLGFVEKYLVQIRAYLGYKETV